MSTLFFDLDGTLSNPKKGIVKSIEYALKKVEFEPSRPSDFSWCIGPPLLDSFVRITGSETIAKEALIHFRDRYSKIGLYENSLYRNIASGLSELSNIGCKLFVVTSKPKPFADSILAYFEIKNYFNTIFGSGLDGTFSDKTELLAYALSTTGSEASNSVMIGDRRNDVVAAQKKSVPSVGVLYGFGSHQELEKSGATYLVSSPEELFQKLLEI